MHRIFPKVATGIFILFMGMMVLVTVKAYMRTSGNTRQDMSQAHLIRQNGLIADTGKESERTEKP